MRAVTDEINMKYPECYTLQCIALHNIHMQFAELGRASKQYVFLTSFAFFLLGGLCIIANKPNQRGSGKMPREWTGRRDD